MGSGRPRREEDTAKLVVEGHLPGAKLELHDRCGAQKAYDFYLITEPGGAALEVTQCIDQRHRQTMEAWRRLTHDSVRVEGLRALWVLMADTRRAPKLTTFADAVGAPLRAAEAGGLTEVYDHQFFDADAATRAAAAGLARLGISQAWSLPPPTAAEEGLVHLVLADDLSAGPGTEPPCRRWRLSSPQTTPTTSGASSRTAALPGGTPSSGRR